MIISVFTYIFDHFLVKIFNVMYIYTTFDYFFIV